MSNTTGIVVSGGKLNTIEFNTASAGLGSGIEVGESLNATVFGNTTNNNGTGGIVVDGAAPSGDVRGNVLQNVENFFSDLVSGHDVLRLLMEKSTA